MSTTISTPIPVRAQVLPGDVVKRVEDIALGLLMMVLFSWLLALVALAVKLTSPGPILFTQERRGKNGRPFRCYKFRTMYHRSSDHVCREQTRRNDPRVTPVGRVLRKLSIDEMPQLINVIRGEMSLVGPRPHAFGTNIDGRLLHEIDADYLNRYQVKPGITGWAQVNGSRGILSSDEQVHRRVDLDLAYIANWSFALDMRILVRTVTCVFDKAAF
jgi:lipopolysaccharide/colanic/teichoic acid biosynthesis glycosyltransferase